MKRTVSCGVLLIAILVQTAVSQSAQNGPKGFAGKWVNDPASAGSGRAAAGAGVGQRDGGGAGGPVAGGAANVTLLDLRVSGMTLTGSISFGPVTRFTVEVTIDGGKIVTASKKATFHTDRDINGMSFRENWTADMPDDDTIILSLAGFSRDDSREEEPFTPIPPPVTLHRVKK